MSSFTTYHILTPDSPNVHTPHTPHRSYHAASTFTPSLIHDDKVHTKPRRTTSMPSMQLNMYPTEFSFYSPARAESVTSSRRSVSGMKQLLPLKLTSPILSDSESPFSAAPSRRTTFGHNGLGSLSGSGRMSSNQIPASRLAIRPATHRDTPVYSKPAAPSPTNFYDKSCNRCSESNCSASCIIDDYEGYSDSSSGSRYTSDDSHHEDEESEASTPVSQKRRDSDFSFKCKGQAYSETSSWFGSPVRQRNPSLQMLSEYEPSVDIEEWLSDSTSMCESDTEENDDFFACATALAPAKAQVVHVIHQSPQSPQFSNTLPPRSSSLPRRSTNSRRNRLHLRENSSTSDIRQFKASLKEQEQATALKQTSTPPPPKPIVPKIKTDLVISSPPASLEQPIPTFSNNSNRLPATQSPTFGSVPLPRSIPTPAPSATDSLLDIVATIEDSTNNFPSKMLLADTPCITSIRTHLLTKPKHTASKPNSLRLQIPFSSTTHPLDRPRPNTVCYSPSSYSPTTTISTISSPLDTTPTPYTPLSSPSPTTTTTTIQPELETNLPKPNLNILRSIFPHSSDFLRSALYAHILAYIYLIELPSISSPQHSQHNPLHKTKSHCHTTKRNPPIFRTPSFSSSHFGIPAKAASTLGIEIAGQKNGEVNRGLRKELLIRRVLICVKKLVEGMEGLAKGGVGMRMGMGYKSGVSGMGMHGKSASQGVMGMGKKEKKMEEAVEGWVLRSLVAVVRGAEGL